MASHPDDILDDELRLEIAEQARLSGKPSRQYLRDLLASCSSRARFLEDAEMLDQQKRAFEELQADLKQFGKPS